MLSKIQPVIQKNWKVEAGLIQGSPKKERKRIPQISKKKQLRLKEGGGEWPFFLSIWEKREHCCEECGRQLHTPRPHNFDHVIGKSHGEEYRLDEKYIRILCFAHHFMKTNGGEWHGIDYDA